MTRVLGLDPGGTPQSAQSRSGTGWSLWYYDAITPPRPIAHGQVKGNERAFIAWWQENIDWLEPDEVVSESFIDDGRTRFPDTTPLKIEGALAVLWPETIFQRNVMKAHLKDAKIKSLGLWWPGEGHAIDSMRHVWALLKTREHFPTITTLSPIPPHLVGLLKPVA